MLKNVNEWVEKTIILGKHLPIITSPSLKMRNGAYDPNGLFSTDFFGQVNSPQWRQMYSVIKLPIPILHPAIYYTIDRRISNLNKWINLSLGGIKEGEGYILSNNTNQFDLCGLTDLKERTQDIYTLFEKSGKITTNSFTSVLNMLMQQPQKCWINYIIIPPPLFRPDGDDVNKFYAKALEELQILDSAISSQDKLLKNRILSSIQNIYHQIFMLTVNKIKGKRGAVRSTMLGRTMDFSARCVVVGDPHIDADHMGVPKKVLVRIFFPWIINYILTHKDIAQELSKYTSVNKSSLSILLNEKFDRDDVPQEVNEILYKIVGEVIKDKVILFKRDPALHKFSIRAYYPIMVDDSCLHVSPAICPGHNMDFDGDQGAVFVPMTEESQREAKEKMLASQNVWAPNGDIAISLEKEFPACIYFLTMKDPEGNTIKIPNDADILKVLIQMDSPYQRIEYRGKVNSLGRRIYELAFDDKINVDKVITAGDTKKYLAQFVVEKGGKWLVHTMWLLQEITCAISTIMGGDIGVHSFMLPDDLRKRRDMVLAHTDKFDVSSELKKISEEFEERAAKEGQFAAFAKRSGGDKKINFQLISVATGYVADVNGNTDPIPLKSNWSEGFKSVDYFKAADGARKGVVDRSQNTAKSGYLNRQMVYLLASVKSSELENCETHKFMEIVLTEELVDVLKGRILDNGDLLTPEYIQKKGLIGKVIKVYSPLYCHSKELCYKCFPEYYRHNVNNSKNIGIISAQTIGERATQLTMTTFHSSGASKIIYLATECPGMEKYFDQDGLTITCKDDVIIKLENAEAGESNTYTSRGFIVIDKEENEIPADFPSNIIFDGSAASKVSQEGNNVILYFEKNTVVGDISATSADVTNAVGILQSTLNHANKFSRPEDLVIELFDIFKVSSKIPLIYIEMIVSQLIRDPNNKRIPYRLGNMNEQPFFTGIKTVPAIESNVRGQLFERFSDIILNNVIEGDPEISDKERMKSDLEDIYEL